MNILEQVGNQLNLEESKEIKKDYPYQIKSLLRKKMIISMRGRLTITERGESAITQQIRNGEYWVGSLKPYVHPLDKPAKIKVSPEYKGYFK